MPYFNPRKRRKGSKLLKWHFYNIGPCGLYYIHTTIVNYACSIVNKLKALLTDNARVIIYDRHVFIVQAPGFMLMRKFFAFLR